ncbi:hypothetical protein SLA2020_279950 [Shorea laevis]
MLFASAVLKLEGDLGMSIWRIRSQEILCLCSPLRGDPFREFHMSILAASKRPSSKWEIIKVNLLSSSHDAEEYSNGQHCGPFYGLGG